MSTMLAERIKRAREEAGLSISDVARQLKISQSAASQWESGKTEPAAARLRKLAEILRVSYTWLATDGKADAEPVPSEAFMPEGKQVALKDVPESLRRPVGAAMEGLQAECWRLDSDALAGGPYRRGDYLVVDTRADQRAGCFVLAEHNRVPIFRLYYPPVLYALPLIGSIPHVIVDNVKTIVKGVVVGRYS